ncbi:uncharacterized protein LOC106135374 [Amyelois transitella]|uniref:uncharacterized protein LOC106135374 n=1 Tax=Amyelois transitella TaxID=680683 RepID=UPI00067C47D2|nr:uncharacterized protein LOC106135374 [Amyelois transitella]
MKLIILSFFIIFSLYQVTCYNYVFGNVLDRVVLENITNVQYNAIPFIKRVKMFFYNNPSNRIIAGIQALDKLHSHSSINITAGGVGYSYVNLRLKSDRGTGLDYEIGIYTSDPRYNNFNG